VAITVMKLITIVAEELLAERLPAELRRRGATGWTMTVARGDGSGVMRAGPLPGENVRIETIVEDRIAEAILERLASEYFPAYALVAWVSEVGVVRAEKYRPADPQQSGRQRRPRSA
jgi:nitrogen regulatory protein P-II 2